MRIPERLLSTFATLNGGRFRGFLTTPTPNAVSSRQPFRTLHVPRPCNVVITGTVVLDGKSNKLLLMDSPQGMIDTKSFRAVQVMDEYSWLRNDKVQDPVSKMDRDNGYVDMGVVYAYFESPSEEFLNKLSDNRYQFYTGQDVRVGDLVDGKVVKRTAMVLGVKLVFAE